MNNKEIIQALQHNLARFAYMAPELIFKSLVIGPKCFLILMDDGKWGMPKQDIFYDAKRYRLRPEYKETQEVVKCEVRIGKQAHSLDFQVYIKPNGDEAMLSEVFDDPNFIGFLYDDGTVTTSPRIYTRDYLKSRTTLTNSRDFPDYKVLTPTHVLFRK